MRLISVSNKSNIIRAVLEVDVQHGTSVSCEQITVQAGYLKYMLHATKAVYEYVVYDSGGVEKGFAEDLEKSEAVKVYAKLPGWFRVPTPLGTYNPNWVVLVDVDGTEKLYFVVETKGSLFDEDLRDKESAKIKCGKAHFEALAVGENPASYLVARNIGDLMAKVV